MRFIINIVCFLFLLPLIATAQTYKYIGVENGLSNRRIFDIQKDSVGYMWFLTNEGIDRYNGKDIKHYKLIEENKESSFPIHLGWLYFEEKGKLWVIGKAGRIFQYNQEHDVFNRVYKLPKTPVNISYGYMDCNHRIWLCSRYSIALYDTQTGEVHQMSNELKSSITSIEQVDNNHFFMGTDKGLRYVKLENETLQIVPLEPLDKIQAQISSLYFHQESQRLFIGTFEKGVFAYDIRQQRIIHSNTDLSDVNIARIKPLNQTELLIATEGMGIHKINMNSCISEPYIVSSYKSHNEMNSNNINDIYIDEEKRIWIANYPEGITIIDNRYKSYNWIKHSIGNRQSLVNDQVHSVIEDSDGDLWFGTSNGISLYQSKTGQWHSFLSSFDHQLKNKNHIFITLCEVSPGIIWAGGYTSGVYKINKRTLSVEYFSPYLLNPDNIRPDKYIRDIVKDSKGYIWSGGFYNLKCFDLSLNSVRLYPGINSVTAITEKDDGHMWIGTSAGLYLLDKESGRFQYVALQEETTYINTLYQAEDLSIYRNKRLRSGCLQRKGQYVQALSQGQLCLDFKQHLHHTPRVGRAYPDEYRKRNQQFPPYGEDIPQLDQRARADVLLLQCLFRNATQEQGFCLWQHRRSHRVPRRNPFAQVHLLSYDTQRFSDTLSDCLSRQSEFPLEGKHQPDRPVKAEI